MLAGIIKQNDNNYYIDLKEENNIKTISIIHSKKNKTRCLKEEEAIFLLETILYSNLTYKEKYNDYDVYLDEADNKRFFKDGKEDFKMFFYNNGIDYIKYKNRGKEEKTKKFKISVGKTLFTIILGSTIILSFPKYRYGIIDPLYNQEITIDDTKKLIYNSNYLSTDEKVFLYNEDFLNDVLEISDDNRNYSLREKLKDIEIYIYDKNNKPHTSGYYNSIEPNIINICDEELPTDSEKYYDTLSHEFVHLLQNESDYLYIHEASAELMSNEYYYSKLDSYLPEVIRLKVLMEIIGPKPIMQCNFEDNDKALEEAISKYLNEEDTNKLLDLFRSDSDDFLDFAKEDKINDEVDKLLANMYKNKTGNDINTDKLIRLIYRDDPFIKRCYFNQNREEFEKETILETKRVDLGTTTIEKVINSNEVESYYYLDTKRMSENEYESLSTQEQEQYLDKSIKYRPIEGVSVEIDDNAPLTMYNEDDINYIVHGNKYNQSEAKALGYLEKEIVLTSGKTVTNFNDIELNKCSTLKITFKDGRVGETTYNKRNDTWGSVIIYKFEDIKVPSIKEKFSDQFEHEESKNIEILDMYEDYVKNDKSEAKLI